MQSNDIRNEEKDRLRQSMQQAINNSDTDAFYKSFDSMIQMISDEVRRDYEETKQQLRGENDAAVLAARGVRQLTSEEKRYYTQLADAMRATNPKQALEGMKELLPTTTINRVFEELQTAHPLLSSINFVPANGAVKMVINTNGYQEAVWGELCSEITKELTAGFQVIATDLMKLSAFIPVCNAMLDLGPEWLDNYVRQVLYEALSNGLENGLVNGTGKDQPIGMIRQVGDGVTVTGGVYPEKAPVTVTDLGVETMGKLIGMLAVGPAGKPRQVRDVLLIVNPADYFGKVMPATTLMAPDGTFRNDVLPYPVRVIQSNAVQLGKAVLGIGYRYLALAGTAKEGRIEYSDQYNFLEDQRVYRIKAYANGLPLDNNAFLYLDISDLQPLAYRVINVEEKTPSNVATLSSLSLGTAALSPAFAAATTTYTASTTNATNTVTAVPTDAGATIKVTVNNTEISNGSAATWQSGSNTVKVLVTAADGTTTKTYTVTVTATLS